MAFVEHTDYMWTCNWEILQAIIYGDGLYAGVRRVAATTDIGPEKIIRFIRGRPKLLSLTC